MSCLRMGLLSRRNMVVDSSIVFLVSFLITLLCFEVAADSNRRPEVKQVTYRVKPVEILGESLTIAEFDIESSQDLYYTGEFATFFPASSVLCTLISKSCLLQTNLLSFSHSSSLSSRSLLCFLVFLNFFFSIQLLSILTCFSFSTPRWLSREFAL
jgi:hypothetical protein